MHKKIITIIVAVSLVLATPAECFAQWINYRYDKPIVENMTFIEEDQLSWDTAVLEENSTYLAPGVKETTSISIEEGTMQHVDFTCEFDLNENIDFIIGRPAAAKGSQYGLATVADQVETYEKKTGKNVVMALNSDMYNMETGEPMGIVIKDSKILHNVRTPSSTDERIVLYHDFFAITEEGEPVIEHALELCYDEETDAYTPIEEGKYQFAVSGDIIVLKGNPVGSGSLIFSKDHAVKVVSNRLTQQPRTAIGIKADGSLVLFSTCTRISPITYSYTDQEIALIMKAKGCETALVMDGGGSTTYISQHSGDADDVCRNLICDIGQREVATTLMITSDAKPNNSKLTYCEKNGHDYQYENKTITCSNCSFTSGKSGFSGLVTDVKTGRYRCFYKGKMIKGFMHYGLNDIYYFNENGLSCEVEVLEDVATTCTETGYKRVFCKKAPAGQRKYKVVYEGAPGHDYNKKGVCNECGWKKVSINDCKTSASSAVYTGKSTTPQITVTTPDGVKLIDNSSAYRGHFNTEYKNNVDIGTATMTVSQISYSNNYMEDRCSITGTRTIKYKILPAAATDVKVRKRDFKAVEIAWNASASANGDNDITYDIYQKTSKGWTLLGNTDKTNYKITGLNKATNYTFRVYASATGKDGKTYKSKTYAEKTVRTKGLSAPVIKATKGTKSGKVKLTWKKVQGADKYKVYRATSKNGKYVCIKTTKQTSTINWNAKKGTTYWYKVKAVKADNSQANSVLSNVVKWKRK